MFSVASALLWLPFAPFSFGFPAALPDWGLVHVASALEVATTTPIQHGEIELPRSNTAAAVPFFSQFRDIASPKWQKVGCGITDLAMIINYYDPDTVSVERLLAEGRAAGAYDDNAGWTYEGLINVAEKYGLSGYYFDLKGSSTADALARIKKELVHGPVIASVHYTFSPTNPIPHLVVVTGIKGDTVYVNDPAGKGPGAQIPLAKFLAGWKKRVVVIRPA